MPLQPAIIIHMLYRVILKGNELRTRLVLVCTAQHGKIIQDIKKKKKKKSPFFFNVILLLLLLFCCVCSCCCVYYVIIKWCSSFILFSHNNK